MSYEDRFLSVKQEVLEFITDRITHNYKKPDFPNWLLCKADFVFGYGIQLIFRQYFPKYINSDVDAILAFTGKNIVCALQAFISSKEDMTLEEIISFTERFLVHQSIILDSWCEPIMKAMYIDEKTHSVYL